MKYLQAHIFSLLSWVALLLLQACYSAEDNISRILNRADSLMQNQADSALSLLEAIPSPEALPPEQSAYYGLLLTQAHDKTYIVHTDDSLIRAVAHYYDSTRQTALQAKSHYYYARVYQDNKNIPACVSEYLIAISKAEQSEENQVACLSYANLGSLFYFEDLNLKANSCYQRAERLAMQLNDSVRLAWILSNQGENYIAMGKDRYPEAKSKLYKAITLSQTIGNKSTERSASVSLSSLYNRLDSAELAVHYARRALLLNKNKQYYGGFLLLGKAYYKLGVYDSAKVYLAKSLPVNNYYTKAGAYMRLSEIAAIEGQFKEAVRFKDSLSRYQDSVRLNQQNVAIVSAIKDMDISEIHQKQIRYFGRFSYSLVAISMVLIVFILLFFYKRKKYRQVVWSSEVEHERLKAQLRGELEQKSLEIERLQCALKQIEVSNEQTYSLRSQIELLENDKKQILRSLFQHADIYQKMQRIIRYYKKYNDYKERFEQEDWLRLIASVDSSAQFKESLLSHNQSLVDDDIYLCYLLKMDLPVIDISIILGCTRDNIYKKKKAIVAKLSSPTTSKDLTTILNEIYPSL